MNSLHSIQNMITAIKRTLRFPVGEWMGGVATHSQGACPAIAYWLGRKYSQWQSIKKLILNSNTRASGFVVTSNRRFHGKSAIGGTINALFEHSNYG